MTKRYGQYRKGRDEIRELLSTLGWSHKPYVGGTLVVEYRLPDTDWHLTLGMRTAVLFRKSADEDYSVEKNYPLDAPEKLAERLAEIDAERLAAFTTIEDAEHTGVRDRELLGRLVREVWVAYAREIGDTKPSHLAPWEELTEEEREVDRRIGERLFDEGVAALARAKLGLNVYVENGYRPSHTLYVSYGVTTPAPLDTNE